MTRALWTREPARYELICPWTRRGGRRHLAAAGLEACGLRRYAGGLALSWRHELVHALDTRLPRWFRGPLVATLFDTLALLPEGAAPGVASQRFRDRKRRAYERIAARAAVIVTLSEAVRREVLSRLPVRGQVEVIPPGIAPAGDVSPAAAARLRGLGIEPPFILTVGALCARKNLETCARTVELLRRDDRRLRWVVAGAPARGWEGSAGERALRDAGDAVVRTGYLDQGALDAAYAQAAAVLHLSHYEGYGLTVLEGLRAGVPVVASRRGGLPEAGGDAAWLVEPGDAEAAAAALRQALAGGEEVGRRLEIGREHARRLTWELAAARVEQVHHELLGS